MKNLLLKGFVITIVLCVILGIGLNYVVNGVVKEARDAYSKPDTTIVIKNGKADTTITIKPLPAILKP